jgi:hypothetical protein
MAVYNSYKLHLALNGSKTSSTGKRDLRQHLKWIEDLIDLLFQVDTDDFGADFTSKPYPKYQYQTRSKGPKSAEKEAFLKTINGSHLNHLYGINPLKTTGHCFFYPKKSTLRPLKEQDSANIQFQRTFKLKESNLIKVLKSEQPKREQFRGKRTK